MYPTRVRIIRAIIRAAAWFVLRVLTRTTITGMEHVHVDGPVIYAGNHTSTFDALLLFILPKDTQFVGPADFKLLWPGNWVIHNAGLILTKRGSVDREGLKRMTEVLKNGGRLGMFPDGGTWEKPIDDVKSGATYLSHATGASIVPMAVGGAYRIWRRIALLQFPHVTITFGEPLPPVELSGDRKRRQDELQTAAVDLMLKIYDLLPPDTHARYDLLARQQYSGEIAVRPDSNPPIDLGLDGVSFDALAELVVKPNLVSPLHRNARLPIRPFVRYARYVPPRAMKRAADALIAAFAEGDYANFLEYRLGDAKAAAIREALAAISAAMDEAQTRGVKVAFIPTVTERTP